MNCDGSRSDSIRFRRCTVARQLIDGNARCDRYRPLDMTYNWCQSGTWPDDDDDDDDYGDNPMTAGWTADGHS